jgi:hypothetical protein
MGRSALPSLTIVCADRHRMDDGHCAGAGRELYGAEFGQHGDPEA